MMGVWNAAVHEVYGSIPKQRPFWESSFTFLFIFSLFGPPMDDTSNEPHIIAASTLSSDSRELHFPNGGNREAEALSS